LTSAEHRASTVTQQKFKDAGLDPATASKHALGAAQLTYHDRSRGGANSTGCGNNMLQAWMRRRQSPSSENKDGCNASQLYGVLCHLLTQLKVPAKAKGVPNYLQLHAFPVHEKKRQEQCPHLQDTNRAQVQRSGSQYDY
jgi:hypothetical protein